MGSVNSIFYDSGKHIEHAISDHKNLKTPANFDAIGNLVSDIIQEAILSPESKPGDVYSRIIEETHFQTVPNDEAIMIACCTAISVAKHSGLSLPEDDSATDFGFPGAWSGESIETMEDLFLLTLFEIWQNLWDIEDRLLQKESEEFYLCRRKTLCFSCRDIRRHPCSCANTRANIGLPPAGRMKIFSTQLHII